MTDRVVGGAHPSEPEPQPDEDPTSVPASTDDPALLDRPPVGAELGAPEPFTADGADGGPSVAADSETTQVMSSNDRLAALVAQTRIRTGRYPAAERGIAADPLGSAKVPVRSGLLAPAPAPQTIGEAEPTEKSQAPVEIATTGSTDVPMRSVELDSAPAPQTIGEGEPTEKSQAPDGSGESSTFGEAVNLDEGPTVDAPDVVPPRRRNLAWKAGIVVVASALGWFAVTQVLPRYRILAGDAPAAVHQTAQRAAPAKEAQPTVPSTPAADPAPPSVSVPIAPVVPSAAPPTERPFAAGAASGAEAGGAATTRPTSRAHSRSRAKVAVRPARSVAEDPDGILPPRNPSSPPAAPEPEPAVQRKIKARKRP